MKQGIIIASFGTTHEETRRRCIVNIEKKIAETFPDFQVMRAFTSRIVKAKLKKKYGMHVFNEMEALEELKKLGIAGKDIYIQPLHIIPAFEYEKLTSLEDVHVSKPLLYSTDSIDRVIDAMDFDVQEDEQLVLFGHGSRHENDRLYKLFNERLEYKGIDNVYMVTAEGDVSIEDKIPALKKHGGKTVYLQPFMIVAGEHAKVDMASEEEGSLKTVLEGEGFTVIPRLIGLGEYDFISDIFIDHLKECMGEKGAL